MERNDRAALGDNCLVTTCFIGTIKGLPEQSCYTSLILYSDRTEGLFQLCNSLQELLRTC